MSTLTNIIIIIIILLLDNIIMDLKEISINRRNSVDYSQDRDNWRALMDAALNLRVS